MKEWDVFISHASEDKELVVLPLTQLLRNAGLRVWIDQQQIKLGDSLRAKIDQGLAGSRFGIVIISPSFLAKDWPTRELNGLSALEENGHKVILPVWHDLNRSALLQHSPMLADRFAANTNDGLPTVVRQILEVVLAPGSGSPSAATPSLPRLVANLIQSDPGSKAIYDFLSLHERLVQKVSAIMPDPHKDRTVNGTSTSSGRLSIAF